MAGIFSPAVIFATIIVVPLGVAMICSAWVDLTRSSRDKADGVVASWAGPRLSRRELILGHGPAAVHIPLAGLKAAVVETDNTPCQDHPRQVQLTVEGHGTPVYRCQPYSYAASTDARKLAMLLNMFSCKQQQIAAGGQHSEKVA